MSNKIMLASEIFERGDMEGRLRAVEVQSAYTARLNIFGYTAPFFLRELRQPLSVIMTDCGTASRMSNDDEPLGRILDRIARCADLLNHAIGDIDRVVAPRMPFCQEIDLRTIIEQSLERVTSNDLSRPAIEMIELGDEELRVTGDAVHLQQAVTTLLALAVNVRKNSPQLNQVSLRAGRVDDDLSRLTISVDGPHSHEVTAVVDTLGSVPASLMFKQDLAVCRAIVEAHSGSLTITHTAENFELTMALPWPRPREDSATFSRTSVPAAPEALSFQN